MLTAIIRKYQGGMTQEEYAKRLGITQGTLSLIYSGKRGVGMDVLRAVAQTFPESSAELARAMIESEPRPRTPNDIRRLAGLPVLAAKEEVA